MLTEWGAVAARAKVGEITQKEYDRRRYYYPEYDTSGQWQKITPLQGLSDLLVANFKEHTENSKTVPVSTIIKLSNRKCNFQKVSIFKALPPITFTFFTQHHSIVAGVLPVISYTTRPTPFTSLQMREETRPSTL